MFANHVVSLGTGVLLSTIDPHGKLRHHLLSMLIPETFYWDEHLSMKQVCEVSFFLQENVAGYLEDFMRSSMLLVANWLELGN